MGLSQQPADTEGEESEEAGSHDTVDESGNRGNQT
jgi:hypothetical protein